MASPSIKSKISHSLFWTLGITLSLASLVIIVAQSRLAENLLEEEIRQRADTIAQGIEFATEGLIESQQPILLRRVVQNYATLPNVVQIEIISPRGMVLASSPNDRRSKKLWEPLRQQLQAQITESNKKGLKLSLPLEYRDTSLFVKVLPFSNSLFHEKGNWGAVIVVLDIEDIHHQSFLNFGLTVGLFLAGILVVLGGTIFVFRQRILIPLQRIQAAIAKAGDSSAIKIPISYEDEIGFLAQTLQQKLTELETLTTQLDQRVQDRTAEVQQIQDFLQTLLEHLPVALFVKSGLPKNFGQLLFWNRTCEEIFGIAAEDAIGKTVYQLHPPEQAAFFDAKDRETFRLGRMIEIPEELIDSQSRGRIYLHTLKVPLYDPNGDPQYLLGISEDITARKQAEDELQKLNQELELRVQERTQALVKSETRYRILLDKASDAIIIADLQGNLVEVNQKAIALLGYTPTEIKQLHITQIHPPSELERAQFGFQEIVKQNTGYLLDTQVMTKTGKIIPIDITGSVIEYNEKQYVQGIFRDISERKKIEAEIQNTLKKEKELNRLKSQFIDIASHEFRTPLTIILGSVEFITKYNHKLTDLKKTEYLERILKSTLKLRDMMEEILVLSRIDANKVSLNFEKVDIKNFIKEIIEDVEISTKNKQKILFSVIDLTTFNKQIYIDPKGLHHIVSNLLTNAIKYSPPESPIECIIELNTTETIIKITDYGMGIPANDLPHIFDSFHRASNVENISGTGLGLNIAKKYVELHGGNIEVKSQVDVGTTFTVHLTNRMPQPQEASV
ncbi:MAG: PAS domain S-box protein [Snowella sp.]|nr:PAS domain S-box protein [Snowella sp.]